VNEYFCERTNAAGGFLIHLVDSDSIAIDRMKRMLIEDNPPLLYADEAAYVRLLASHEQSLDDALDLDRHLISPGSLPWRWPLPLSSWARRSSDSGRTASTITSSRPESWVFIALL
jgi:hypothetical protein